MHHHHKTKKKRIASLSFLQYTQVLFSKQHASTGHVSKMGPDDIGWGPLVRPRTFHVVQTRSYE